MPQARCTSRVELGIYTGNGKPPCRLCGTTAALSVRPSGWTGTEYSYCAGCVDAALERFDVASMIAASKEPRAQGQKQEDR